LRLVIHKLRVEIIFARVRKIPWQLALVVVIVARAFAGFSDSPTRKAARSMQAFRRFRILTAVGLPITLSLAALAFDGTASAVTPLSAVTCSHLLGFGDTAALSGCSAAATGGFGEITSFFAYEGDVTWGDGSTTDYISTFTISGTKCSTNLSVEEVNIKGTVTSSTNASIPEGAAVKMTVCYNGSSTKLKNAHGTVVKF
jgi:hypothetical protein